MWNISKCHITIVILPVRVEFSWSKEQEEKCFWTSALREQRASPSSWSSGYFSSQRCLGRSKLGLWNSSVVPVPEAVVAQKGWDLTSTLVPPCLFTPSLSPCSYSHTLWLNGFHHWTGFTWSQSPNSVIYSTPSTNSETLRMAGLPCLTCKTQRKIDSFENSNLYI